VPNAEWEHVYCLLYGFGNTGIWKRRRHTMSASASGAGMRYLGARA